MTREEAIKGLKTLAKEFSGYKPNEEMFDMAIKALEQSECEDAWIIDALKKDMGDAYESITESKKEFTDWLERLHWHVRECDKLGRELEKLKQSKPCEDAVSRKAVEEMLQSGFPARGMWEIEGDVVKQTVCETLTDALMDLEKLPSVTPQQRWIPCSKRLPDREMPVWLTIYTGDVIKAVWRNMFVDTWGYAVHLRSDEMLAWMPRQTMPEPFQEEGEQE